MSLRTKTLLVVVLGLGLALGLMELGARWVVLAHFDRLEHEALLHTAQQTKSVVLTMVDEFQLRSADWADWDDMVTFLEDANDGFREANLTADGLASCNWDAAVVVKADGQRVFSARRDREASTLGPVDPILDGLIDRGLLNPSHDEVVAGAVRMGDSLYLVASRRVRMTDRSKARQVGRFVTVRMIDPAWVERLHQFTFLEVALHPLHEPANDPLTERGRAALDQGSEVIGFDRDQEHYVGFTRLADLEGKPLFDLQITVPRPLRQAGEQMSSALIRYGLMTAVALALLSMLIVGRFLLRPLAKMLDGVRRFEAGERVAVQLDGKDELAQLAQAFNGTVRAIGDREDALRLVLDSIGEGLVLIDFDGRIQGQVSALAQKWFGAPGERLLWDWLPADGNFRAMMMLNLEQVREGYLPFEAAVDQLPKILVAGEATYCLEYRGVWKKDRLDGLLVVIDDATERLAAERVEQEARELEAVVRNALRDKTAVPNFLEENQALTQQLSEQLPVVDLKRTLHTIKGNAALFGLESVAQSAHVAEDAVVNEGDIRSALSKVQEAWHHAHSRITAIFGDRQDRSVELDEVEYERFLATLLERNADQALTETVRSWRHAPSRVVLGRFARQIEVLARRLGKEVVVQVHDPGGRLPRGDLGTFFATLVHVVRNAVDHGIETSGERLGKGKPAAGRIELSVHSTDQEFLLEIKDDGRGIDWEAVRLKAEAAGFPARTTADLTEALFQDGLSTKSEVSEISGRGVGLGAVRAMCRDLGGRMDIETRAGLGTTFRFRFPREARSGVGPWSAAIPSGVQPPWPQPVAGA